MDRTCLEDRAEPVLGFECSSTTLLRFTVFRILCPQLGKLAPRIPAFLEIEVHAIVDGLDHHLLAPVIGKEDEWYCFGPLADGLQKREHVHIRHLVIRDYNIAGGDKRGIERGPCRSMCNYKKFR
ncbi:MAG: hypothetical protein WCF90_03430 [Methanomicrobiales archaeon]